MQILVSQSANAPEFTIKQRLAVNVGRNTWQLATVVSIRRKYIDVLFDDGDEGEFNKVDDIRSIKFLPKGIKKNKLPMTSAQIKELMEQKPEPKASATKKAAPAKVSQVTRRVLDMTESPAPRQEPERKGRPITITMKPRPPVEAPKQTTGTLKTKLKEHDDKPIHPIDLARGMVVQAPVSTALVTLLLLDYDEDVKKWSTVLLRENSKIVTISPNQCFTHKAPLTPYEKLWVGKYMRRLEELES